MKDAVKNRKFESGQPLELIHYKANQVLDYNTDEEAYKWMELMIQNVERPLDEFVDY